MIVRPVDVETVAEDRDESIEGIRPILEYQLLAQLRPRKCINVDWMADLALRRARMKPWWQVSEVGIGRGDAILETRSVDRIKLLRNFGRRM